MKGIRIAFFIQLAIFICFLITCATLGIVYISTRNKFQTMVSETPSTMRTVRYYDDLTEDSNLVYFRFNQSGTSLSKKNKMKPLSKEGYSFVGYFDQPNAMGTQYTDSNGNFIVDIRSNLDVVLYPAFVANEDGE